LFFEDGWGAYGRVDATGEELFAETQGGKFYALGGDDSESDAEKVWTGKLPGGNRPRGEVPGDRICGRVNGHVPEEDSIGVQTDLRYKAVGEAARRVGTVTVEE